MKFSKIIGCLLLFLTFFTVDAIAGNPQSATSIYPGMYEDDGNTAQTWPAIITGDPFQPVFANRLRNSILQTQKTLGVNPQGGAATVALRLAAEHESDGSHTAFATNALTLGKDTWTGVYQPNEEDEPQYSSIKILFGNQQNNYWEEGIQDISAYIEWKADYDRIEVYPQLFSPGITANYISGPGAGITGIGQLGGSNTWLGYNQFNAAVRVGSSENFPSLSNGHLYIGTNDAGTLSADNVVDVYTTQFGLIHSFSNPNSTTQKTYFISNAQNALMGLQSTGTNKYCQLDITGTGNAANLLVISGPNAASGSTAHDFTTKLEITPYSRTDAQIVYYNNAADTTLHLVNYSSTYKMNVDVENNLTAGGILTGTHFRIPSIAGEDTWPDSPGNGDMFINIFDDTHTLYVYVAGGWRSLGAWAVP